ncbi:uncharacterized protein LOC134221980 [Armigeres subalbatus]|uniref:uncharacterized protein LOC134221980 n=1 Tax=Armigeres subalbatus TaxID=124917 RepID=UPI002ED666D4
MKQKSLAVKASYGSVQSSGGRCTVCKENHPLYQCSSFQRLSVREREAMLRSNSLCRNCFRPGHIAKNFPSKYFCRSCKGRHNTLVCFKSGKDRSAKVAAATERNNSPLPDAGVHSGSTSAQVVNVVATDSAISGAAQQFSSHVLLATAVVIVEDDEGSRFPARALLDSGSESNFIAERLSQRLRTRREKVDISVLGIGQAASKVKHRIQALVHSRTTNFSRSVNFLVLTKVIADLPTAKVNMKGWKMPDGISLADPAFFSPSAVDMVHRGIAFFLISSNLVEEFPSETRCRHSMNRSLDGWCAEVKQNPRRAYGEAVGTSKILSTKEQRCEELFQQSVHRESDGRYTVSLPKDEDVVSRIGESRDIVYRRFLGTEHRLPMDANLREQYHQFMAEYIQLWHMSKVKDTTESENRCFLPHHPVIKEASTTTKLATDEKLQYPLAARAVTEDTYMDDVIIGADTIQAASEIRKQLEEITSKGGFRLRKWASNELEVLEGVAEDNLAIRLLEGVNLDPDPTVKTLGLTWMPNTDQLRFQFDVPACPITSQLSNRQVLSVIASLFDPLGLIVAVITTAKAIMQLLWKVKDTNNQPLDWGQPLPSTLGELWRSYYDQLPMLNDLRIDRCVVAPRAVEVEIHCFCDASTKAFGGCVYIRSEDHEGEVKVRLLSSKLKVAPLKIQSIISRLDLCGALLTAQLYEKWQHVSGKDNPADLISRGINPKDIVENTFWWEGPEWLKREREGWPCSSAELTSEEADQERR